MHFYLFYFFNAFLLSTKWEYPSINQSVDTQLTKGRKGKWWHEKENNNSPESITLLLFMGFLLLIFILLSNECAVAFLFLCSWPNFLIFGPAMGAPNPNCVECLTPLVILQNWCPNRKINLFLSLQHHFSRVRISAQVLTPPPFSFPSHIPSGAAARGGGRGGHFGGKKWKDENYEPALPSRPRIVPLTVSKWEGRGGGRFGIYFQWNLLVVSISFSPPLPVIYLINIAWVAKRDGRQAGAGALH